MMQPPPASRIGLIASRMPRKTPTWLTWMTRRYSSSEVSSIGLSIRMPALLSRMLSLPNSETVRSTAAAQARSSVTSRWT